MVVLRDDEEVVLRGDEEVVLNDGEVVVDDAWVVDLPHERALKNTRASCNTRSNKQCKK